MQITHRNSGLWLAERQWDILLANDMCSNNKNFVWKLWKTFSWMRKNGFKKHLLVLFPRESFYVCIAVSQSCMLLTDRIEIHQLQPLVWPSDLLFVMLSGCDWWISNRLTESLETFPRVFCFIYFYLFYTRWFIYSSALQDLCINLFLKVVSNREELDTSTSRIMTLWWWGVTIN